MSLIQRLQDNVAELQERVTQLVTVSDQLVAINAQLTERITTLEGVSPRTSMSSASSGGVTKSGSTKP